MTSLMEIFKDIEKEWECSNCGAIIDIVVADVGDPYHAPDEDCRAVRQVGQGGRA